MMTTNTNIEKTAVSISRRGKEMPGSPIRKLAALAEGRKKSGIHVYHLNIGQPDLPTDAKVFEAIRTFSEKTIAYAPSNGLPLPLTAWRHYLDHYGIHFDESELIITTGGSEAITFALCAVCDSDSEIIVFEPTYANYIGFAGVANVKVCAIPTSIENGFHLPSEEEIERYITDRTRAILFSNPSNPTGTIYSKEELQRLVNLSLKHGLFLLSDDAYREFAYDAEVVSLENFSEIHDRTILLDSCSKRFNVCGVRIGLLASHNKDVVSSALKFGQARLSVATLEQLAMVPLLEDPDTYTKPIVEEFRKRRDTVCDGLQSIPGITFYKPEGAFYITIGLPVQDSEHFSRWLIEEYDDQRETVLLAPAQGFYATRGKGMNEVRLAFMLKIDDLKRSLIILKKALEVYQRKFLK
jgi:aspartate aminotransferase